MCFLEELPFIVIIPFPEVTFCLFCEFLVSLHGSHVCEGPLPGSSFLGCFLSVQPLPVCLVHFLTILSMFNFSWPCHHSCFEVFVPLFCLSCFPCLHPLPVSGDISCQLHFIFLPALKFELPPLPKPTALSHTSLF